MKDYSSIGLDSSLRKIGGIASEERRFDDAYSWDALTDVSLVSERKIRQITADMISAGTITVALNLGGAGLELDGANTRIVVNDGTTDRVLIGKF